MDSTNATLKDRVIKAIGDPDDWNVTPAIVVAKLDQENSWTDDFMASAIKRQKEAVVRKLLKTLTGPDNFPLFASIKVLGPDGTEQRVYRPEKTLKVADYQLVSAYHQDRGTYHIGRANAYINRCNARYGTQMQLPFPELEAHSTPSPTNASTQPVLAASTPLASPETGSALRAIEVPEEEAEANARLFQEAINAQ